MRPQQPRARAQHRGVPARVDNVLRLPDSAIGTRFDHAIAELIDGASVREVRNAIKEGTILINGRKRVPGDRVKGGEDVDVGRFTARAVAIVAGDPDLVARLLYEDPDLIALDKPSGVNTAPLRANESGTLLNAAIARAPAVADAGPPLEGGLLHRLDRDTSGVVVFAKDRGVRATLRLAFEVHRVEKRYLAVVNDPGLEDRFTIEAWIAQAGDRVKIVDREDEGALHSASDFVVLRRRGDLALVEATTFSGRRHQIRIHLANVGAPILGDALYGDRTSAPRLALHASSILLPDRPRIESPFPPELEALA